MKIELSILTLLFAINLSYAQTLEYKVISNKKVIGNLTVNKKESGRISEYTLDSKFKLPFKSSYSYRLVCSYRDGILTATQSRARCSRRRPAQLAHRGRLLP